MAKTINTRNKIINLNLEPIQINDDDKKVDLELGRAIALVLTNAAKSKNPMRSYELAMKLVKEDTVELEPSDIRFIKDELEVSTSFNVLISGQILLMLE